MRLHGSDEQFQIPPGEDSRWGFFRADPLIECDLTPDGLTTPTTERLAVSNAAYLAARLADYEAQADIREAERRRQEEERRRIAEAEAREAAAARRVQAADDRLAAWMTAHRDELTASWEASDVHAILTGRYGSVPAVLAQELPHDLGIRGISAHWHSVLYAQFILDKPQWERFTIGDCYKTLSANGFTLDADATRRSNAVIGFLDHLAAHDLVYISRNKWQHWKIDHISVLGDVDTAHPRKIDRAAARAARQAKEEEEKRLKAAARKARAAERLRADEVARDLRLKRAQSCSLLRGPRDRLRQKADSRSPRRRPRTGPRATPTAAPAVTNWPTCSPRSDTTSAASARATEAEPNACVGADSNPTASFREPAAVSADASPIMGA